MSTEKEDQNWLEALGRKQIADKLSPEIIEAQVLRSAVLQKLQNEEQFEPSNSAYKKILEEAKNRKLLKGSKKSWSWFGLTGGSGFSISGGVLASPTYVMASIALIIGLTVIVGYQTARLNSSQSQADTLRGQKYEQIVLLVKDPKVLVNQLQREFIEKGVNSSITFESDDSISIQIPVNDATIDLMLKRRIELPPNKFCTLVIKKPN